jgi:hypothetical protein
VGAVVSSALAPKWTPRGFAQRVRRIFHEPSDPAFALAICWFMWRAPGMLQRRHLHTFLRELRQQPRPHAAGATQSLERIQRLRQLCLRLPFMRSRDNCYVRALTLYRFLEAGADAVGIHFGIEGKERAERLRGHAWVSLNGEIFEGPPGVIIEQVREVPVASLGAAR